MKQRVLLLFLFVLFCLGLVGCAAVYPQEELAVKGGFDGAYYIYSDKVHVYLRYSGKEDYLRAPLNFLPKLLVIRQYDFVILTIICYKISAPLNNPIF